MSVNNVGRDYLVGTVLVIVILAVAFVLIRLLNGVVEPEVEREPQRLGQQVMPQMSPAVAIAHG